MGKKTQKAVDAIRSVGLAVGRRVKPRQKRQRGSLTVLFTLSVTLIFATTLIVAATLFYILLKTGIIDSSLEIFSDGTLIVILLALSCLIVGIGLTFLLSLIPLTPVNRMINAMNRLATGDFHVRLSVGRPLESNKTVMELEDSFNMMASELEKTEVLRSDFVNNFSHEFKTPIVSIAGFAGLLRRGDLTEEQRQEYLGIIEEESRRLARMATNVLNLNRVESQTILTDVTSFNLSEQLRTCVLIMDSKLETRDLELELDFDEFTLEGNEELLKQVWINLLDNAVKFTSDGGRIHVAVIEDEGGKEVMVTVSNTGEPIPPEIREHIFRKFYQGDTSHASEGNGIGLAVVRRILALHGGEISVDCADGVTTFTVILPVRQAVPGKEKEKEKENDREAIREKAKDRDKDKGKNKDKPKTKERTGKRKKKQSQPPQDTAF